MNDLENVDMANSFINLDENVGSLLDLEIKLSLSQIEKSTNEIQEVIDFLEKLL